MNIINKDLEQAYDYYVGRLIGLIEKKYQIDQNEMLHIWRNIKRPKRKKRHGVNDSLQEQKKYQIWNSLNMLKYEDLCRHCIRSGIQPSANKQDMIKAIMTKMCVG